MIDLDPLDLDPVVRSAVEDLEDEVEIERFSNKGMNGHLFFGRHRILDRQVAVKFYYWAHSRTHDEPRLLSSLGSDHVIPIYSARFVDDEWAMFQTPYYSRGDLDQVAGGPALSLHQAIDHLVEILVGVSALHSAGLVHRDLKPANIFIDDEGRARIGDFGSVMLLPDGADHVQGSGHSVLYRPPESFRSNEYGRAGDIYQCGIVLFQLLGGHLPYDEEHWLDRQGRGCWQDATDDFERSQCVSASISRMAERQRLLDMTTLPGTVPRGLRTILRRATRPEPDDRYSGSSQFINELRAVRSASHDWVWTGDGATAQCRGREVRIVREREGRYRCESNKGAGWRKLVGVEPDTLDKLTGYVDAHF